MISTKKSSTITEPYISVNKLAEYMQANSTRRRQIIKSLKEDKDFRKVYYSEVRGAMPGYFRSGYDNARLDTVIKRIEKKKGTTAWENSDNPNSVLALQKMKVADKPILSDYDIVTDVKIDEIVLGGLKVIIKPDIYLQHKVTEKIGAVKIHIAKTEANRLTDKGLEYAATIIKYGLIEHGHLEAVIDNKACISFDIFQGTFATAPRAYKRDISAITAACEEIVARWPTL